MSKVLRTTTNENPNNPGTTTYYEDGTSSFEKSAVNSQGLTSQQMIEKANSPVTPIEAKPVVSYGVDGTRTLSAADKFWADNPVSSNADFEASQTNTKADFAKRQQDAIDSINNMYVGIISKANQTAEDKMGSANVINALSGNRGSASGAANVDRVNNANDEIMKGVLAEKQNKINTIMSNTYKDQTEELRYQNDLRRKDLDSYLSYMGTKETENLAKSKAMRAELISGNIKIEDIAPDTLKQMAENAGYTVEQFKVLYESERKAQEKAFLKNEEKRLADLEKTKAETEKLKAEANPVEKSLLSKGYIPVTDPTQLKGLKESDIQRVGEKVYLVPQSIKNDTPEARLTEYEAKKKIDSKYRITGGNSNTSTKFYSSVKDGISNLQKGESWGTVFNRIKSQYPDISDGQIDVALGPEWKEPGAFENWKSKQYKQSDPRQWENESPVWQWLASDEAANMSDEEKKQEIMSNGFNPEDFGIY